MKELNSELTFFFEVMSKEWLLFPETPVRPLDWLQRPSDTSYAQARPVLRPRQTRRPNGVKKHLKSDLTRITKFRQPLYCKAGDSMMQIITECASPGSH